MLLIEKQKTKQKLLRFTHLMKIRKADKKDIEDSLSIVEELKEWFTKEAIKNMKVDFTVNNLVVAVEKNKVVGFLCFNYYEGIFKILWMGVKKNLQSSGIGSLLVKWLEKEAKKIKSKSIEVETLTDEDDYEPYKLTRAFYYKHGFKKLYIKKARKKGWDDQVVLRTAVR